MSQPVTSQSIFDQVAKALIAQGAASYDPDYGCAYRSDNGHKCAVGHLLLDEEYDPKFEGRSADIIALPDRLRPFKALLRDLQDAHDLHLKPSGFEAWRTRMWEIAYSHGLSAESLLPAASESF